MESKRFRIGSVAVLFAAVVLCVAILGALTVSTAVADQRTAQRYGQYVETLTACQNQGQQWLRAVDDYRSGSGMLPEHTKQNGEELQTTLTEGNVKLTIRLKITDIGYEILEWRCSADWQPENDWSLWQEE